MDWLSMMIGMSGASIAWIFVMVREMKRSIERSLEETWSMIEELMERIEGLKMEAERLSIRLELMEGKLGMEEKPPENMMI